MTPRHARRDRQPDGSQNPGGRQFYVSRDRKTPIEVVGVAHDGKYTDVREPKLRLFF